MNSIVMLDRPRENPGELDWSDLNQFGQVTAYEYTPEDKVAERIGKAEIVLTNKTPITRETLTVCPNIRFISVIATGYNLIDIDAAREKGILVSNVPTYGTEGIGQHAIALLLEITNRVAYNDAEVHKGRRSSEHDWCFWDYPIIELAYKTIGIIGLGRIGRYTARVAQALGMKVLAYDVFNAPDMESDTCQYVGIETLFSESDVIVLHCPLTSDTENMINKNTISQMKNGVIIINNSRGALIDEQDLADALNSGRVYAAGLDTIPEEPIRSNSPLLSAKNCYITPHISWAAIECRRRLKDTAIDNLRQFLSGAPVNLVT